MIFAYTPKLTKLLCGDCNHELIYQRPSFIDSTIIKEWYCPKCMRYPLCFTHIYG